MVSEVYLHDLEHGETEGRRNRSHKNFSCLLESVKKKINNCIIENEELIDR